MNSNIKYGILALSLMGLSLQSCKKSYLDTVPSDAISNQVIFKTTETGYMALNGLHALMTSMKLSNGNANDNHRDFGVGNANMANDLMGNDMVAHSAGGFDWFINYYNYLGAANVSNEAYNMWFFHYRIINNANAIINGIDGATGPDEQKRDIKGQALAYRAWAYHRILTRFSRPYFTDASLTTKDGSGPGVPIYLTASGGESQGNARGTMNDVIQQMTSDINAAIELLGSSAASHTEKSHINIKSANGIAARIAMYKGEWAAAVTHATAAKAGHNLMTATAEFNGGLNDRSIGEFIWCSTLTAAQYGEFAGIRSWISFMDETAPGYAGGTAVFRKITKDLYDRMAADDKRRTWWVPGQPNLNYFSYKFRVKDPAGMDFDMSYMRASEMYLIIAEAAARSGNVSLAQSTLQEFLTTRHTGSVTAPSGAAAIIDRVLLERRIELWGEGFAQSDLKERYLPLNRPMGSNNHDLTEAQTATLPAGSNLFTFKIPQAEINANPNISATDQNP